MTAPCGVDLCPALADGADGFCCVHRGAKRAPYTLNSMRCPTCQRKIEADDWITRDSTLDSSTHAFCPVKRPYLGRIIDRVKPLFDGL